ncbi:hypothetical protein K438DRAFT_1964408 [Mycena galopus ATCC 62051]|nr:hypothetical protein K438DRAFT_1964408 [Mycena galopus ATCC 62051]
MRFNFNFIFFFAITLATFVSAQGCPETSRFGYVDVSPAVLSPGDIMLVFQISIFSLTRTYDNSTSLPIDQFTAVLPDWFYVNGTAYSILMKNSFARLGPINDSIITTGGIYGGIFNITGF